MSEKSDFFLRTNERFGNYCTVVLFSNVYICNCDVINYYIHVFFLNRFDSAAIVVKMVDWGRKTIASPNIVQL